MVGFGNPNFDNAPKDEKDTVGTSGMGLMKGFWRLIF